MMKYLLIIFSLILGGFVAIQGSINAHLSSFLKHPLQASLVNFIVGTIVLLGVNFLIRTGTPEWTEMKKAPFYLFLGGILGALFVSSVVILIPKIGVTTLLAATIAGQLIVAAVIDHFGYFGVAHQPINVSRIAGIVLLLVGIMLVQK